MTWIRRRRPSDPEVAAALEAAYERFPSEYSAAERANRDLPDAVKSDSIVMSHSLMPDALRHVFLGYAAMMDEALPLSRRQQEMIAVVVSVINDCFY